MKYSNMRAEANEDSSLIDLSVDGGSPANRPSTAIKIPENERTLALIFAGGINAGTDPDNKTFSWKLFGWKDENAPAEIVGNGTGILGTQRAIIMPNGEDESKIINWADTIAIVADVFITTLAVSTAATDSVAKLILKTGGYRYFYIEITSADGVSGTEAGSISVWFSAFKDA